MNKIPFYALPQASCVGRWLLSDAPDEYEAVDTVEDARVILFGGGIDINPKLYDEDPEHCSHFSDARDALEVQTFEDTKDTHLHLGICRGAQLFWILHGKPLWQDITGHALSGTHDMLDHRTGRTIDGVTSLHHQASRQLTDTMDNVVATTDLGFPIRARAQDVEDELNTVIEAHWHEETNSLGIQGHPEFGGASRQYRQWCLDELRTRLQRMDGV